MTTLHTEAVEKCGKENGIRSGVPENRTSPHITTHHYTSPHITNLWA